MPQAVTIKSIAGAFRMIKAMQAHGIEWGEDYRQADQGAVKAGLHAVMNAADLAAARTAARRFADRWAGDSCVTNTVGSGGRRACLGLAWSGESP